LKKKARHARRRWNFGEAAINHVLGDLFDGCEGPQPSKRYRPMLVETLQGAGPEDASQHRFSAAKLRPKKA
jgi:hypothetical protein